MSKKKLFSLAVFVVAIVLFLAACGASGDNWVSSPDGGSPPSSDWVSGDGAGGGAGAGGGNTNGGSSGSESTGGSTGRMIIFTYQATIFTYDMDESIAIINSAWNTINGAFVQSSNRQTQGAVATATIVIRIPSPYFEQFISRLPYAGTIRQETRNSQDITQRYFDLNARLESLQAQRERLLELMETASFSQVIDLNRHLSNVEAEINSITRSILNYQSLTELSTATLNLRQETPPVEAGYGFWQRIGNTFRTSGRAFSTFFQFVLRALIITGPFILFFGVLIGLPLILHFRVFKKRRAAKSTANDWQSPPPRDNDGQESPTPPNE